MCYLLEKYTGRHKSTYAIGSEKKQRKTQEMRKKEECIKLKNITGKFAEHKYERARTQKPEVIHMTGLSPRA